MKHENREGSAVTINSTWIRPEVRQAFAAASREIFNRSFDDAAHLRRGVSAVAQFVQRYDTLCALPRRARRALQRSWKKPLAAIALLLTLGQGTALAATINVAADTPPDISADGKCSLVEAIVNANADAATHADCVAGNGKDTIVLPAGSTQHVSIYYRNSALPVIHSAVTIEGRSSRISMPGDYDQSLFVIDPAGDLTIKDAHMSIEVSHFGDETGVTNEGSLQLLRSTVTGFGRGIDNTGSVVLNHSTLSNNRAYLGENCAALWNRGGNVTVSNSLITRNNSGGDGGGLCNDFGTLVVSDSEISHNLAYSDDGGVGGGIVNHGTLVVTRSKVVSNSAAGGGGIVNEESAMATISDSIIEDNSVADSYDGQPVPGGGILNLGTLMVSNSTLANNSAYGNGSGMFNRGKATLTNTTVTGNSTFARSNWEFTLADTKGGGIYNAASGELDLANVTLVGNSAGRGGGVFNAGTVMLTRSLVTGNQGAAAGREITNNGGTVMVNAFNLFGHNGQSGLANVARGATDIVPAKSVNSIVLPLANNGGKTQTHALAINSPALNASPADAGCPAKDQRGAPRPSGAKCDIGAFEGSAVMCSGVATTHVGTPGADVIDGTPGKDVIAGLGGNDTVRGLDGDDIICGGVGSDKLVGGKGVDVLLGQTGNDTLWGEDNDDVLNGGEGTDKCNGGTNDAAGDYAAQCEAVVNVP